MVLSTPPLLLARGTAIVGRSANVGVVIPADVVRDTLSMSPASRLESSLNWPKQEAAELSKLSKNAKFPLLINDICGRLGSGIALALSFSCRGV